MCFICLKMKYLDQIRAMLIVLFSSVKISLHILDRPGTAFAFQFCTEKTVCSNIVIYIRIQ